VKRTRIMGTGSYLPKQVLRNEDLAEIVETSDEWIRSRTGVLERRIADPDVATSDLALPAAQRALEAAGISPDDLDMILVATITPDTYCPSAACWLQGQLSARRAVAFDLNAACSGFVFGLSVADQYIRSGSARYILFVAAEVMSRTVNWKDRSTCILWGDGAGAVVLAASEDDRGVLSTHLHSDGSRGSMLIMTGGGSRATPISHQTVEEDRHTIKMQGPDSFKIAVRAFSEVCREALEHNGLRPEDVALFVPHQANLRIIDAVAKRLSFPLEKICVTIHKYGNISSATIPIALDEAVREKRVREGDKILMAAFGGGLTWGASTVVW